MSRFSPEARSIDGVGLSRERFTTNEARGGIGRDPVRSQMRSEPGSPLLECRLFDMQSLSVFAHRLQQDMNMRVRLICMQHERVAMFECKLFSQEVSYGIQNLFGRRPRRHREHQFMN